MRLWMTFAIVAAGATALADPASSTVERVTQQARVCTASGALPVGTAMRLVRRVCTQLDAKRVVPRCHDEEIARGEVVRADGPRCAIVELPAGAGVQPGDACLSTVTAAR